jgi:hypothetical protein
MTLFEFFDGHPERWSQGSIARRKDGSPTSPDCVYAVKWDVEGAICTDKFTKEEWIDKHHKLEDIAEQFEYDFPHRWNDSVSFEEFLRVLKVFEI